MNGFKWRFFLQWLLRCSFLALTSCAVGPNYRTPELAMPTAFVEEKKELPDEIAALTSWWTSFRDPLLDVLIHEAVQQNLDFHVALEKIAETRALYHLQTAELFPKIDLNGEQRRSRISQTLFESPFLGPTTQDAYRLGFDASWEIDVFGKIRRAQEASFYDYESQIENARDIYITLLGDIASEYIQIRSLQNQIDLKKKNIVIQNDILNLTRSLFDAGLASDIEVETATALLEQEKSALPPLEEGLSQGIYRLAVLLGKPPENLDHDFATTKSIPTSTDVVPVGLPSELLRRRPDIRRAERILAMETANIGVAVAQLFPSFSIMGEYSYKTTQNGKWFKPMSRQWRFGPNVNWPILYFGRLRANIHVATAQQEQALLNYKQTILQALEEVESNLVAYNQEQHRLTAIIKKRKAADERYLLNRDLYISGLIDFSTLLTADQERLRVQSEQTLSQQTVSTNLVALYKSLGGDWPSSSLH